MRTASTRRQGLSPICRQLRRERSSAIYLLATIGLFKPGEPSLVATQFRMPHSLMVVRVNC